MNVIEKKKSCNWTEDLGFVWFSKVQ